MDGQLSIHDFSAVLNLIRTQDPYKSTPGYFGPIIPGYECADVSGATGQPDGQISIHDFSAILNEIRTKDPYMSTPGYYGPCLGMLPPPEE
jgi:hypothetical protein